MAYEVKKINPLDLQPRKAIGVSLPFSGAAVFNSTYESKDAVKYNLVNYFLTGLGERYLNPTFGTPLRNLLFENITEDKIDDIKNVVKQGLDLYFPRVVPSVLEVQATPDNNTVVLLMRYSISDTNIEDELVINFEQ